MADQMYSKVGERSSHGLTFRLDNKCSSTGNVSGKLNPADVGSRLELHGKVRRASRVPDEQYEEKMESDNGDKWRDKNTIQKQRDELIQKKRANRLSSEEKIPDMRPKSKHKLETKESFQRRERQESQGGDGRDQSKCDHSQKGISFTIKPFTIKKVNKFGGKSEYIRHQGIPNEAQPADVQPAVFKAFKTQKGNELSQLKNDGVKIATQKGNELFQFKAESKNKISVKNPVRGKIKSKDDNKTAANKDAQNPKYSVASNGTLVDKDVLKSPKIKVRIGPKSKVKRHEEDPQFDADFLDYCLSKHYKLRPSHWRNKAKVLKRLQRKYKSVRDLFCKDLQIILDRFDEKNEGSETKIEKELQKSKESELVDPRVVSMSLTLQSSRNGKVGLEKTFKKVSDKKFKAQNYNKTADKTPSHNAPKVIFKPDWPKLKEKLKQLCVKKFDNKKVESMNRESKNPEQMDVTKRTTGKYDCQKPYGDMSEANESLVSPFRKTISSSLSTPQLEGVHSALDQTSKMCTAEENLPQDLCIEGYSVEVCSDEEADISDRDITDVKYEKDIGGNKDDEDARTMTSDQPLKLQITSEAIPNLCAKGAISPKQSSDTSQMSPPVLEREVEMLDHPRPDSQDDIMDVCGPLSDVEQENEMLTCSVLEKETAFPYADDMNDEMTKKKCYDSDSVYKLVEETNEIFEDIKNIESDCDGMANSDDIGNRSEPLHISNVHSLKSTLEEGSEDDCSLLQGNQTDIKKDNVSVCGDVAGLKASADTEVDIPLCGNPNGYSAEVIDEGDKNLAEENNVAGISKHDRTTDYEFEAVMEEIESTVQRWTGKSDLTDDSTMDKNLSQSRIVDRAKDLIEEVVEIIQSSDTGESMTVTEESIEKSNFESSVSNGDEANEKATEPSDSIECIDTDNMVQCSKDEDKSKIDAIQEIALPSVVFDEQAACNEDVDTEDNAIELNKTKVIDDVLVKDRVVQDGAYFSKELNADEIGESLKENLTMVDTEDAVAESRRRSNQSLDEGTKLGEQNTFSDATITDLVCSAEGEGRMSEELTEEMTRIKPLSTDVHKIKIDSKDHKELRQIRKRKPSFDKGGIDEENIWAIFNRWENEYDSDETSKPVPIKKRQKQQTFKVKESSFTTEERLMCDFPKHNWLFNKYSNITVTCSNSSRNANSGSISSKTNIKPAMKENDKDCATQKSEQDEKIENSSCKEDYLGSPLIITTDGPEITLDSEKNPMPISGQNDLDQSEVLFQIAEEPTTSKIPESETGSNDPGVIDLSSGKGSNPVAQGEITDAQGEGHSREDNSCEVPKTDSVNVRQRPTQRVQPQVFRRPPISTIASHTVPCQPAVVAAESDLASKTSTATISQPLGDFNSSHTAGDVLLIPVQSLHPTETPGKFTDPHTAGYQSGALIHVKAQSVSSFYPPGTPIMPIVLNPATISSGFTGDSQNMFSAANTHSQNYDNYSLSCSPCVSSYQDIATHTTSGKQPICSLATSDLSQSLAPPPLLIQVHPQTVRAEQSVITSLESSTVGSLSSSEFSDAPFVTEQSVANLTEFKEAQVPNAEQRFSNEILSDPSCLTDRPAKFNGTVTEVTVTKDNLDIKCGANEPGKPEMIDSYISTDSINKASTDGPSTDSPHQKAGSEDSEDIDDEIKKEMEELDKELKRREQEQAEMLRKKMELMNKMKAKSTKVKKQCEQATESVCMIQEKNDNKTEKIDNFNENINNEPNKEVNLRLRLHSSDASSKIDKRSETNDKQHESDKTESLSISSEEIVLQCTLESEKSLGEDDENDDDDDDDDDDNLVIDLSSGQKTMINEEMNAKSEDDELEILATDNTHEESHMGEFDQLNAANADEINKSGTTMDTLPMLEEASDVHENRLDMDNGSLDLSKKGNTSYNIPVSASGLVVSSAMTCLSEASTGTDISEKKAAGKLNTDKGKYKYETAPIITPSMAFESLSALKSSNNIVDKSQGGSIVEDNEERKLEDINRKGCVREAEKEHTQKLNYLDIEPVPLDLHPVEIPEIKSEDKSNNEDDGFSGSFVSIAPNRMNIPQSGTSETFSVSADLSIAASSSASSALVNSSAHFSQTSLTTSAPVMNMSYIPSRNKNRRLVELLPAHIKRPEKRISLGRNPEPAHLQPGSIKHILRKLHPTDADVQQYILQANPFKPRKRPLFSSPEDHDVPIAKRLMPRTPEPAHNVRPFGIPGRLIVPTKRTLHKRMFPVDHASDSHSDPDQQGKIMLPNISSVSPTSPSLDQAERMFEITSHHRMFNSSSTRLQPPRAHGCFSFLSPNRRNSGGSRSGISSKTTTASCVIDLTADMSQEKPVSTPVNVVMDSERAIQFELKAAVAKRSRLDFPRQSSAQMHLDNDPQFYIKTSSPSVYSPEGNLNPAYPVMRSPIDTSPHPQGRLPGVHRHDPLLVDMDPTMLGRLPVEGHTPLVSEGYAPLNYSRQENRKPEGPGVYSRSENRGRRGRDDPRGVSRDIPGGEPVVQMGRPPTFAPSNQIQELLLQPHPSMKRDNERVGEPVNHSRNIPQSPTQHSGPQPFDPNRATTKEEQIRLQKMQMVREHYLRKQHAIHQYEQQQQRQNKIPMPNDVGIHDECTHNVQPGIKTSHGFPVQNSPIDHSVSRLGPAYPSRNCHKPYEGGDTRSSSVESKARGQPAVTQFPIHVQDAQHFGILDGRNPASKSNSTSHFQQSMDDWNKPMARQPPSHTSSPEVPVDLVARQFTHNHDNPPSLQPTADLRHQSTTAKTHTDNSRNRNFGERYFFDNRERPSHEPQFSLSPHVSSPSDVCTSPIMGNFMIPTNYARAHQFSPRQTYLPRNPLSRPPMLGTSHLSAVPTLSPRLPFRDPAPRFRVPASPGSDMIRRVEAKSDADALPVHAEGLPRSQHALTSIHPPPPLHQPNNPEEEHLKKNNLSPTPPPPSSLKIQVHPQPLHHHNMQQQHHHHQQQHQQHHQHHYQKQQQQDYHQQQQQHHKHQHQQQQHQQHQTQYRQQQHQNKNPQQKQLHQQHPWQHQAQHHQHQHHQLHQQQQLQHAPGYPNVTSAAQVQNVRSHIASNQNSAPYSLVTVSNGMNAIPQQIAQHQLVKCQEAPVLVSSGATGQHKKVENVAEMPRTFTQVNPSESKRPPVLLPKQEFCKEANNLSTQPMPRPRGRPRRLHMPGEIPDQGQGQGHHHEKVKNPAILQPGVNKEPARPPQQGIVHQSQPPPSVQGPVQIKPITQQTVKGSSEGSKPLETRIRSQVVPDEMPHLQQIQGSCIMCGKFSVYLCSSCKKIWYCSPQCQLIHWKTHAAECVGGAG